MRAADFSGYATKANLKCSDGRTITPQAFQHMDGKKVPLVFQHVHNDVDKVLGHVLLEARDDGMYCHAFFNDTPSGKTAKKLVLHGDIDRLSIWANQLVEKSKQVLHGVIKEVSLVLAGANPGAFIDQVLVQHGDGGTEELADEAIIHTGLQIILHEESDDADADEEDVEHSDVDPTMQEIYNGFSADQKEVVHAMLLQVALKKQDNSAEHSDDDDNEDNLEHEEGTDEVMRNAFETQAGQGKTTPANTLTHADIVGIFEEGKRLGSFKKAIHSFLDEKGIAHGVDGIELLFPDAKAITDRPDWDKRRTEWVASVLSNTHKTPFSSVKSLTADLTLEAARAKGYVTGAMKKEEFFPISTRSTTSTTVYKKQKLDRDRIIDITDFDIVAWLWGEIRLMFEEELARAILIGDGREVDDEDKIKDPAAASSGEGIRSILHDHDYYAQTFNLNLGDASSSYIEFIDSVISNRRYYKGTGLPTMYTTEVHIAKMLTLRDAQGRRFYRTLEELATELRVSAIVPVEVMESEADVIAILVNLADYNIGTNKGGEIATFDDFDIDYNQYKYLMEARLSGALIKVKSAQIYKKTADAAVLVTPNAPTFVSSTGVVTIVATTGVVYKNKATGATLSTGAQTALAAGASVTVVATPASSSYYLLDNVNDEWTFTRDAA